MFWTLIIGLGLAWALQSALSWRQLKAFSSLFVAMRRQGKVCMGKFRGRLAQGAIVMFLLDEDGGIRDGRRLAGVSVLARFRPFPEFNGQAMGEIQPEQVSRIGRSLVKAVANAKDNYRIVAGGGQAPEPPSAASRTLEAVTSRWRRKSVSATS